MFGSAESDARSLLSDVENLITQNEYEYQRSIASLHLILRQVEVALEHRKVTDAIVEDIGKAVTNIKYQLRNARDELGDAEGELNALQAAVLALEANTL